MFGEDAKGSTPYLLGYRENIARGGRPTATAISCMTMDGGRLVLGSYYRRTEQNIHSGKLSSIVVFCQMWWYRIVELHCR